MQIKKKTQVEKPTPCQAAASKVPFKPFILKPNAKWQTTNYIFSKNLFLHCKT